jgi:hypothetical protein
MYIVVVVNLLVLAFKTFFQDQATFQYFSSLAESLPQTGLIEFSLDPLLFSRVIVCFPRYFFLLAQVLKTRQPW